MQLPLQAPGPYVCTKGRELQNASKPLSLSFTVSLTLQLALSFQGAVVKEEVLFHTPTFSVRIMHLKFDCADLVDDDLGRVVGLPHDTDLHPDAPSHQGAQEGTKPQRYAV